MLRVNLGLKSISPGINRGIMNLRILVVLSPIMMGLTVTAAGLAQTLPMPQPDRAGDYLSNEAPVQGTVPRSLMAGGLWQVVATGLNCRSQGGMSYAIARQFTQGELLQADVGRGGADEVLFNAKDQSGKPWMRVRSATGTDYHCYVRANRRYIQPYRKK
jgi:hypothetical protein